MTEWSGRSGGEQVVTSGVEPCVSAIWGSTVDLRKYGLRLQRPQTVASAVIPQLQVSQLQVFLSTRAAVAVLPQDSRHVSLIKLTPELQQGMFYPST